MNTPLTYLFYRTHDTWCYEDTVMETQL